MHIGATLSKMNSLGFQAQMSTCTHIQSIIIQASNVKFANISRACLHGVSEEYVGVVECEHGEKPDEDLMPFFLSNPELMMYYCNINEDSHRHARAQACKSTGMP